MYRIYLIKRPSNIRNGHLFLCLLQTLEQQQLFRRTSPPSTVVRKEDGTQAYLQFCSADGIPLAPIRLQYFKWIDHTHLILSHVNFAHIGLTERHGFNKGYLSLLANTHLKIMRFIMLLRNRPEQNSYCR